VLITLDTRLEFWGGLCHGCSPVRQSIFELGRSGVWVEEASRHRKLVEAWIREDIEMLREAQAAGRDGGVGNAALNLYLDAESAGQAARYRDTVKRALGEIGWKRIIEMLDRAERLKCRLVDVKEE